MPYYVYMLHECPIERPYNCKIGFTANPQRRLRQLQAGNPRPLRTWIQPKRPIGNFGFALPTRTLALELERRILVRLEGMGLRLRQDYDYERHEAEIREWIQEFHPQDLWHWMCDEYVRFLREKNIALPGVEP